MHPGGLGAQFVAEHQPSRQARPADEHLGAVVADRPAARPVRRGRNSARDRAGPARTPDGRTRPQPLAGHGLEIFRLAQRQLRRLAHALDGARERMIREPREVVGHPAQVAPRRPGRPPRRTSCRSPAVSVPVLSSATTSTLASASSAAPPRNSTPAPRAERDGREDRRRDAQHQRARRRDDQQRHRPVERAPRRRRRRDERRAGRSPSHHTKNIAAHSAEHAVGVVRAEFVGEPLRRGAHLLRVLDEVDDLLQRALARRTQHAAFEQPVEIDRAGEQIVAEALGHGARLRR